MCGAAATSSSPAAAVGWPLVGGTVLAANIGAGTTVGAAGLVLQRRHQRLVVERRGRTRHAGARASGSARGSGARLRRTGYLTARRLPRSIATAPLVRGLIAVAASGRHARHPGRAADRGRGGARRGRRTIPAANGVAIGGVAMTVYFTAGGLLSSAWVNAVQLVVLIGRVRHRRAAGGQRRGWVGGHHRHAEACRPRSGIRCIPRTQVLGLRLPDPARDRPSSFRRGWCRRPTVPTASARCRSVSASRRRAADLLVLPRAARHGRPPHSSRPLEHAIWCCRP